MKNIMNMRNIMTSMNIMHEHCDKHKDKKCKCDKHDTHKECKCHDDKLEESLKKIKELEEEVLKAKADNINYRKRKDEEVSKMLRVCE